MRMIFTGVAAVFAIASVCGALAAPAARGPKADSSAITVQQTATPQDKTLTPSQTTKPGKPKASAHRYKGHRASLHRTSHRHRTSMHPAKRTSTKAMKNTRKTQKPS
jgi:hypothetical protein